MAFTLGDLIVYLKGDSKDLDRTLDSAEQKSKSVAGSIGNFFQQAFSHATGEIITRSLSGIVGVISQIKEAMIGGNTAFEQYETQFSVLLGNADLAHARLQELAEFGQRTPVELPELVQADRILQSFGLHAPDVVKHFEQMGIDLRTITGDIAAGTGASYQEIATAIGRFSAGATGEAIQRFQELGITTRSELAAMGVEFSKSGELTSPLSQAMDVLLQIVQQKFGGMMEAQAQTFGGMFSNFQDWIGNTGRILGEPVFDALKSGLQGFLELVQPGSPVDNAIKEFANTIRLAIEVAGTLLEALTGGGVGSAIENWASSITAGLQRVNEFLRQLKDEIMGLTAGDILGELGPGLANLDQQMNKSLADLAERHNQVITGLQQQLANAGTQLAKTLAEINEKYAKQIADLNQRITDTAEQFQERLSDLAEQHAKRRADIEHKAWLIVGEVEEKLTELKKEHMRRRRELSMDLLTAETEEQYLNIKEQLKAEDEKYNEQKDKTKKSGDERRAELRAQLAEEDAEYEKQRTRLEKQRDKALADLHEQLAEVQAEKAKEVAEARKSYDEQVKLLNDKIAAENAAYAQQQDEIKAMYAQRMQEFQADIEARAAAIGTGPAAVVGEWVRWLIDGFERLKTIVADFITNHATPLQGILLGIGAVILGGGILAGLSALAGLLSGISLPILAIVAAVALLYTAWQQNWGGIQEKTMAVVAWLQANVPPAWEAIKTKAAEVLLWLQTNIPLALMAVQNWWAQHGAAVQMIITGFWTVITTLFQTSLQLIQSFWQQHGDFVIQTISLSWANIQAIIGGAITVIVELLAAFFALITGDWDGFITHLKEAWDTAWETVKTVASNSLEQIENLFSESIETWSSLFNDFDWSSIGSNIVGGIQSGLEAAWGGLVDWITSSIGALPAAAAAAIGSQSPSRDFADRVGETIPPGIGLGFERKLPDLRQQVAQGMQSLIPQAPPAGALAGAGGTTQYISLSQTNNLPQAPTGFDRKGLMNEIQQQTIDLLGQFYTKKED